MPELIKSIPETKEGCQAFLLQELNANRDWHKCVEGKLDILNSKQDENTEITKEFVEILRAGKGGLKVLGWIGFALKWVAGIAGAIYTLYCIYTGRNIL